MGEIVRWRKRTSKSAYVQHQLIKNKLLLIVFFAICITALLTSHSDAAWQSIMHNSQNLNSSKWSSVGGWGVTGGKYGQFTCGTCHTPRAANIKGIKDTIQTGDNSAWPNGYTTVSADLRVISIPASDANVAYSLGWDSVPRSSSTRICEVCHSITNHHKYSTGDQLGHYDGQDCASACHPHSAGFKVLAGGCNDCHGNPPASGAIGGPGNMVTSQTGATNPSNPGAHVTHVTSRGVQCDGCHYANLMATTDANITIGFNVNGTTYTSFASSWSGGTFTGYTSLSGYVWRSTAGTAINKTGNMANANVCSNIYCHGSTIASGSNKTPQWTSGGTQAACGTCHGASTGTPPTLGSHQKHAGAAPTNLALGCTECHPRPAYTNGAHVNGSVTWDLWATDSRIGAGTYKNTASGNTGTLAPSASYGSCNNIYCHSDVQPNGGTGAPTYAAARPVWGSVGSVTCGTSCHANTTMATGRHTKHIGTATYNMPCSNCHNGAGSGTAAHGNYRIDVVIDSARGGTYTQLVSWNTPGNGYGSCVANYCHSQGTALTSPVAPNNAANWATVLPTDCTGCHNNAESTGRWMTSGSHQTHVALTQDYDCSICHSATVSNNLTVTSFSRHANQTVDIVINAAWTTGTGAGNYSTIYKAPGAPYGTCTGIYCHSDVQAANGQGKANNYGSPNWGSIGSVWIWGSNGSVNNGQCSTTCHNTAVSSTKLASGSHQKHTWASFSNLVCTTCHAFGGQWTTRHAKGFIDVSINNTYGGSYSQPGTWNTPGNGFGSCSKIYCHGSSATPWWGSSGSAGCGLCHAVNNALAGKHGVHYSTIGNAPDRGAANNSTTSGYIFNCGVCHNSVTHAGGVVNGSQAAQVSFDPNIAKGGSYTATGSTFGTDNGYNWTAGSCASTYCHGGGYAGSTPSWTSFNWSTVVRTGLTAQCAMCHEYNITGHWMTTGRHAKHVQTYGNTCNRCHNTTTTNGTTISDKTRHVNGQNNVSFDALNSSGTWNSVNKSCTTTYCHSQGNSIASPGAPNLPPSWTTVMPADCTGCHKGDVASGRWMTSGSHNTHVDLVQRYDCSICHSITVINSRTISTISNHANQVVDVMISSAWTTGTGAGNYSTIYKTPGAPYGTCTGIYCHSDVQAPGGLGKATTYGSPVWGSIGSVWIWGSSGSINNGMCATTCHPTKVSTPALQTGSHQRHTWASFNNYPCTHCHFYAGQWTTRHAKGFIDVSINATLFGGSYSQSGTWNTPGNGYGSCRNTYCHSGSTPTWGTGSATCGGCHTANNSLAGRHGVHYSTIGTAPDRQAVNNSTSTTYIFRCGTCHYLTSHAGGIVSGNQTAEVMFDPGISQGGSYRAGGSLAGTDGTYEYTAGSCFATRCHGGGIAGTPPNWTSFNWTTVTTTGLSSRCYMCHKYKGTANQWISTGRHSRHVSNYQKSCELCHNATTTNGTTISDKAMHVNQIVNVKFDGTNSSGAWNSVNKTCSNTYCHSSGTTVAVGGSPTSVITWTTTTNCGSCHGIGAANGRPWHTNVKANSHQSTTHKATTCDKCHNLTTTNGSTITGYTYHGNKTYDLAQGSLTTFSYTYSSFGGSCANVSCHGGAAAVWGSSGSLACGGCHAVNNSLAGKHSLHWATGGNAPDRNASNDSTAATYKFRCGVCHFNPNHAQGWVTTYRTAEIAFDPTVAQGGTYFADNTSWGTESQSGYKWTRGRCASTYCHSGGIAAQASNWTSFDWSTVSGGKTCYMCHKYKSTANQWISTGRHSRHVSNNNKSCEVCHNATTTNGTTIADKTVHANGVMNVKFDAASAGGGTYTAATKTCNASYCHSDGRSVMTGLQPISTISWNATIPAGTCNMCHGVGGGTNGRPNYANYLNGKPNSHQAGTHAAQGCQICHVGTTTNGTSITSVGNHANKVYNVSPSLSQTTFTYTYRASGDSTCGGISGALGCHSGATAVWGSVGSTNFTCVGCHGAVQVKSIFGPGGGLNRSGWLTTQIRNISGSGGDFSLASRHVMGGTVMSWDCIVCHREGSSGGSADGSQHKNGIISLRDMDTVSQTAGWDIDNRAWRTTDYDNLDQFCLRCHDVDGARAFKVNATNNGIDTTVGGAKALLPFNSTDQTGGRLKASTSTGTAGRVSVVNVKDQFFPGTLTGGAYNGNPSQHAVIGRRYTSINAGWVAGAWTAYGLKKDGKALNTVRETALLSCADCHVLDAGGGAHGGAAFYNIGTVNVIASCQKCHSSTVYTSSSAAAGSRFTHSQYTRPYGSQAYGFTSGSCLVCHATWTSVAGNRNYGGIHGSWSSTATWTNSTNTAIGAYRFFPGAWRKGTNFTSDAGFAGTTAAACYFPTAGETFTNCTSHAAATTGTYTPAYARPTKY